MWGSVTPCELVPKPPKRCLLTDVRLDLCECEPAAGFPHGLGCEREGWFVSNFEFQGTWMGGGGLVPLSRAICCRPCLPVSFDPVDTRSAVLMTYYAFTTSMSWLSSASLTDEVLMQGELPRTKTDTLRNGTARSSFGRELLSASQPAGDSMQLGSEPQDAQGGDTAAGRAALFLAALQQLQLRLSHHAGNGSARPVAVVSIGCHPSSGRQFRALNCEAAGNSFVTGAALLSRPPNGSPAQQRTSWTLPCGCL